MMEHLLEVHVFRADYTEDITGELQETEEMKPQWFEFDQIPYHLMWADDILWCPLFLQKKLFKGRFLFQGQNRILCHNLQIAEYF